MITINSDNKYRVGPINDNIENQILELKRGDTFTEVVTTMEVGDVVTAKFDELLSDSPIGYLGTIDTLVGNAPTPRKNGWYKFNVNGNMTWIAPDPIEVKKGDELSVEFISPATHNYTYISRTLNLSDSITSSDTTVAASSLAVKTVNDNKSEKSTTITAGAGLAGGGDLSTNRTIDVVSSTDGITVNADNIILNTLDVLNSTSTTKPLSANQGKQLNDNKVDKVIDSRLYKHKVIGISGTPSATNWADISLYDTCEFIDSSLSVNRPEGLPIPGEGSTKSYKISIVGDGDDRAAFLVTGANTYTMKLNDFVAVKLMNKDVFDSTITQYNATNSSPLESGYHTLTSAIASVPVEIRKVGLNVIFKDETRGWLTYTFLEDAYDDNDTWTDTGSWTDILGNKVATRIEKAPKTVELTNLTDEVVQYVGSAGNIINNADGEDLTPVVENSVQVLKLKDKPYSVVDFQSKGNKILRKNIVSGQNRLTSGMLSANTIHEIKYDFNLNGAEISPPANSVLDFAGGGSISNGRINYANGVYIQNGDNVIIPGKKLPTNKIVKSNWIDFTYPYFGDGASGSRAFLQLDITQDYTISNDLYFELSNNNSKLIINGNNHTITLNKLLRFSANKVILNDVNIIITAESTSGINFHESSLSKCSVELNNCNFQQLGDKNITFGLNSVDNAANKLFDYCAVGCHFEGLNHHFKNEGLVVFDKCTFNQTATANGLNNAGNNEMIHVTSPLLTKLSITNSKFKANGYKSDLIDLYNTRNVNISNCYFEGSFEYGSEVAFINPKSHGMQVDGLPDTDNHGRTYNIIISENTFVMKGVCFGMNISNYVRDESVPIEEKYKKVIVSVFNNTFVYDGLYDGYAAIRSKGAPYFVDILYNKVYLKSFPTIGSTNYEFYTISDDSTSGDNVTKNIKIIGNSIYKELSLAEVPDSFTFLVAGNNIYDSIISDNIIPTGYTFINDRSKLISVALSGNSFDESKIGSTANRPSVLLPQEAGFQYFDTTLFKPIWWTGAGWVDSSGVSV